MNLSPTSTAAESLTSSSTNTLVNAGAEIEQAINLTSGSHGIREMKSHFLALISLLDHQIISERYVRVYCDSEALDWTKIFKTHASWDSAEFRAVLNEMQELSLLTLIDTPTKEQSFRVDASVRTWSRNQFDESRQHTLASEFLNLLLIYLRRFDESEMDWKVKEETLRHIGAYIRLGEDFPWLRLMDLDSSLDATLLFASKFRDQGQYSTAKSLLEQALAASDQSQSCMKPECLDTMDKLGQVYGDQSRHADAEDILKRTLSKREELSTFGDDFAPVLYTMENLANCYRNQAKFDEAEALFGEIIKLKSQKLEPRDPSVLASKENLAILYSDQGKYTLAEDLFGHILMERTRRSASDHWDISSANHNMGAILCNQNRHRKAEEFYEKALSVRRERLGPQHPHTQMSLAGLATVYIRQERYVDAETLLVQILPKHHGSQSVWDPSILFPLESLAILHALQDRLMDAEMSFRLVWTECNRLHGSLHPNTLQAAHNLAICLQDQGRYDEAEELYALASKRDDVLGREHPKSLQTVKALAMLHRFQGREDEAGVDSFN